MKIETIFKFERNTCARMAGYSILFPPSDERSSTPQRISISYYFEVHNNDTLTTIDHERDINSFPECFNSVDPADVGSHIGLLLSSSILLSKDPQICIR